MKNWADLSCKRRRVLKKSVQVIREDINNIHQIFYQHPSPSPLPYIQSVKSISRMAPRATNKKEKPSSATPTTSASTTKKDNGASKPAPSRRRAVACKSCHTLKVKCIPSDPDDLSSPCVRCIKTRRVCEIDTNYSRKKRKQPQQQQQQMHPQSVTNSSQE